MDNDLRSEFIESEKPSDNTDVIIPQESKIDTKTLFDKNAFWFVEDEFNINDNHYKININSAPVINSNFNLLFNVLEDYTSKGIRVYLTAENDIQAGDFLICLHLSTKP